MRVLTVPNWSFGRDKGLLRAFRDYLETEEAEIHFLASDVDHNRTVSAFSGRQESVAKWLMELGRLALPGIDLNRHLGCHPRMGALDVCPFIPYTEPEDPAAFNAWIDGVARQFAEEFEIPVFLYERSEKGRHTSRLPDLRKGGFGGLLAGPLDPDFGPTKAHPYNGATVMGWRRFLVAMNLNLKEERPYAADTLARKIRVRRQDKDPMFRGVRALGFALSSRDQSQLSMNLTEPDSTPIDPILQWAREAANNIGVESAESELIGVIRPRDLEHAVTLPYERSQVVDIF